jgi:multimeric flavodoxin WrbA
MRIEACLGCFCCWVTTPGECIINDNEKYILVDAASSDLLIFLTQISFGGYSSVTKKVLDRMIPMVLPLVEMVDGEVHHIARYKKNPCLLFFGEMTAANRRNEVTFRRLVERTGLNSRASLARCEVLFSADGEEKLKSKIAVQMDFFNGVIAHGS